MRKISIITINYNDAIGLEKTIVSVLNQTYSDFEFIVIDGNSTDGSKAIIEQYQDKFTYWISEPDAGIYNAMNKGIKIATGEYLLFLNSGDHFFNSEVIKECMPYLTGHDLIYFNVQMVGEQQSQVVSYPDKLRFSDFYFNGLCHQSVLIRKVLFETVGLYDENLKIVSDWKFFILALFVHHCSYIKIDKTLSTYYLGGISSQGSHLCERNQVLKEYFSAFILDYEEWHNNRALIKTNRFKMLTEIEKSILGKKIVSVFFRTYVMLFLKIKIKNLLK